jgi:hypothetical protein
VVKKKMQGWTIFLWTNQQKLYITLSRPIQLPNGGLVAPFDYFVIMITFFASRITLAAGKHPVPVADVTVKLYSNLSHLRNRPTGMADDWAFADRDMCDIAD